MPSANSRRPGRRPADSRRRRMYRSYRYGEDDRGTVCLVICGILFVLLVAVKLLLPETAEKLAGTARQVISRDADFEEAFAAVGRMVSGETSASDALQEAYVAVFNPALQPESEPTPEPGGDAASGNDGPQADLASAGPVVGRQPNDGPQADPAPVPEPAPAPDTAPRSLLRQTVLTLPDAERTVRRELVLSPAGEGNLTGEPASAEAVQTESVGETSSIYAMAALPENASLEQRNLGFEHCTPVQGRLTSAFGWREHPIEGGNRFHYGVDLGAATGTDILAFADGEVYAVGESSSLGNYIMLRHEGEYITLYGHCSRVTASSGRVSKGEKIAEVGATGIVTGPHLHFELHDGEVRLNPIYYVAVG